MQSKSATNVRGIDVSHHNVVSDWSKVKADGNQFVYIKCSEGSSYVDDKMDDHYKGAKSVGLHIGFYHYAHAELNDAAKEAAFFVSKIKPYQFDLPLALDLEGASGNIGKEKVTKWAVTFLETVKKLTGSIPMIYTGASFAKNLLGKELAPYPLWVAHYGVNTPMSNPTWSQWSVFQYTSSGKVSGINGNVDMNSMEKAFFDKLTKPPVAPKPTPLPPDSDKVKVVVNDILVAYGRILEDGHTYLPLRKVGEAIDKTVEWDNAKKLAYVDGQLVKNIKLIDNVCFAQIREAAEKFGGLVSFDNGTKKVYIYN